MYETFVFQVYVRILSTSRFLASNTFLLTFSPVVRWTIDDNNTLLPPHPQWELHAYIAPEHEKCATISDQILLQ